jgi:hypothetical protein
MIDGTTVVCLPPSKFLVAVMGFLGFELVHLNPNAIAALSCFIMLCECKLQIMPDINLFRYFYSSARYDKVVVTPYFSSKKQMSGIIYLIK